MQEAATRFLQLAWLSGREAGPVLQLLFGVAVIVGSLLLWAVLLFRKAAVLLVAMFAPVAFAGAVWDHTRVWTRRWVEAVVGLVFCRVVIVVVFALGVTAFGSEPAGATAAALTSRCRRWPAAAGWCRHGSACGHGEPPSVAG